jgi:hypothetical protein
LRWGRGDAVWLTPRQRYRIVEDFGCSRAEIAAAKAAIVQVGRTCCSWLLRQESSRRGADEGGESGRCRRWCAFPPPPTHLPTTRSNTTGCLLYFGYLQAVSSTRRPTWRFASFGGRLSEASDSSAGWGAARGRQRYRHTPSLTRRVPTPRRVRSPMLARGECRGTSTTHNFFRIRSDTVS